MEDSLPELLGAMQTQLSGLYDVELRDDVRDFLVTDRELLCVLTDDSIGRQSEEQLVVIQSGSSIDLALYLDRLVLDRLRAADPRVSLSDSNLADFWTVLEGVSHFNYLAWNAAFDKPVTLLELEMQAEVDKYVCTRLLMEAQPTASLRAPLIHRLFVDPGLDPRLDAEEVDRYQTATLLASRYCASLEARFSGAGFDAALLRELRAFYRQTQTAKIARIRAAGFA